MAQFTAPWLFYPVKPLRSKKILPLTTPVSWESTGELGDFPTEKFIFNNAVKKATFGFDG